ncbi:MAG: RNA 2',3'-cyclic phosphodiesterase [Chloroflexota bacterium]
MADRSETFRLFIAVPIPATVRAGLGALQCDWAAQGMPFRWTRPVGMHLTLVFLGQTPAELVEPISVALREAARSSQALRLAVCGLGCFPGPSRPRVLWAGLDGDVSDVAALQRSVAQRVTALGLALEDRAFRPHVTLGRATGPLQGPSERFLRERLCEPVQFGEWKAESVELVRSQLRRDGSVYTTLSHATLGGSPSPGLR